MFYLSITRIYCVCHRWSCRWLFIWWYAVEEGGKSLP